MSAAAGPTIVLIGGRMTVDDGASFDSRQRIEGDETSEVTLRSLATSLLWWRTTISLVMPILDCADETAFALVVGQRSVIELRQDGTFHRTSLRSVLPGGTTQVEIIRTNMREPLPDTYEEAKDSRELNDDDLGTVGFKRGEPFKRWRFLNGNEYYLSQAGPGIGPKVIVDTTPWFLPENYRGHNLAGLEASRLFCEDVTLVAPHTYSADHHFKAYAEWVERGRPPDPPVEWIEQSNKWDSDARLQSLHYATPIPIAADFGVTGLVVNARWEDPADLDAARSLLQARYDLKIGIWDLASNPTLRKTLLEVTPVLPAPPVAAAVPREAAKRAESEVDAKMASRSMEKQALLTLSDRLGLLKAAGWVPRAARERWLFRLPLTELVSRWTNEEPIPFGQLEVSVAKRSTTVSVFTTMYNQVSLPDYLEARREELARIAGTDACPLGKNLPIALWRSTGGWDDDVDWAERDRGLAERTPCWVEVFADLWKECRRIRRESGYVDR